MAHTFINKKGERQEVEVERWQWIAVYKDGTTLRQFGEDGVFHQIGEIRQEELEVFSMVDPSPTLINRAGETKKIDVLFPAGARLVHKYKQYVFNSAALNKGSKQKEIRITMYIFGYKIGGHLFLNHLLPDGRVVQADRELNDLIRVQ